VQGRFHHAVYLDHCGIDDLSRCLLELSFAASYRRNEHPIGTNRKTSDQALAEDIEPNWISLLCLL
jgi:hypothetical protein